MRSPRFFALGGASALAVLASWGLATPAEAQGAAQSDSGLEEIIVTAQKREQLLTDVPVAITALSSAALQANRVVSVTDLSGLAPGVTVRPAAGGQQIPSFSIRGALSYGVVPGSDKEVSIYLDGVYISSPRGSIFDLPDVQRIEVLRGPQGTLFGRNATAGAVSVSTRDPSGKAGVQAQVTVGNYDQARFRLSLQTPQIGPFNFYGTYLHSYKRGDVYNAGGGTLWDLSNSPGFGVQRSPYYLGTRDSSSYFAAAKFEPSDNFSTIYKFDHLESAGSPEATGLVGVNTATPAGAAIAGLFGPGYPYIYPDGKRPDVVNNGFALNSKQRNTGHSLTSNLRVSDSLTFKNIAAYRSSYLFSSVPIDGFSAIPLFGGVANFLGIATHGVSTSRQWSDELQANYDSRLLTLTVGGLYFKSKDESGAPFGLQNTYGFQTIIGNKFPVSNLGISRNNAESLAIYAQGEIHLTPKLDVVLGGRLTRDRKSGQFLYGNSPTSLTSLPFEYKKTKPSYLVGLNFKPTDDTLLYGKFSTAFVSGGSVAGIVFQPETAESYEIGAKGQFFNRRLQVNLSAYTVTYKHVQSAAGSSSCPFASGICVVNGVDLSPVIGTFIIDQGGPVKSRGFEFDILTAPVRGVTLGGSLSYSDTVARDVSAPLLSQYDNTFAITLRPDWTANLNAQYETPPIINDAQLSFRVDANYHSKARIDPDLVRNVPAFAGVTFNPAVWLLNGRVALHGFKIGGIDAEIAVWGKNLTNDRSATYALVQPFEAAANYQEARTYGLDLGIKF